VAFTDEEILEEFVGAAHRAPRKEWFDPDGFSVIGRGRVRESSTSAVPRGPKKPPLIIKGMDRRTYHRQHYAKRKQDPEWLRRRREADKHRARERAVKIKANAELLAVHRAKRKVRGRARYLKIKADPVKYEGYKAANRKLRAKIYADKARLDEYNRRRREKAPSGYDRLLARLLSLRVERQKGKLEEP